MVKFQDYYETLGLSRTATPEEIKLGFRKLARVHHPDVAKDKVAGEAKFKEINEAYEVLSDPEKRRRYDDLGANWQGAGVAGAGAKGTSRSPGPSGESDFEFGGTGFSDFFESFFGAGRDGSASRARAGARSRTPVYGGEDIEADILVTLEEALRGSSRKVTLRRPAIGASEGRVNTYEVRIPPGVREGQRIRLAGQGGAGVGGGGAGDLYLRVRLATHPDLTVIAADLYAELELAPWETVLGVQAKIPTLDGAMSLRVPPNTQPGSQLRLRGLGLPRQEGTRGDLYVTVRVRMPATVSPEEHALWEQLAKVSAFKARTEP